MCGLARCPNVLCEHGNPFDLSISVKGGEETKADSGSSGERKQRSLCGNCASGLCGARARRCALRGAPEGV